MFSHHKIKSKSLYNLSHSSLFYFMSYVLPLNRSMPSHTGLLKCQGYATLGPLSLPFEAWTVLPLDICLVDFLIFFVQSKFAFLERLSLSILAKIATSLLSLPLWYFIFFLTVTVTCCYYDIIHSFVYCLIFRVIRVIP